MHNKLKKHLEILKICKTLFEFVRFKKCYYLSKKYLNNNVALS